MLIFSSTVYLMLLPWAFIFQLYMQLFTLYFGAHEIKTFLEKKCVPPCKLCYTYVLCIIINNPSQKFWDCIDFLPLPLTKQCCGCDGGTFWSENDYLETTLLCRGRGINIMPFRKEQICFHKNEQKIRPLGVGLNIFCEGLKVKSEAAAHPSKHNPLQKKLCTC